MEVPNLATAGAGVVKVAEDHSEFIGSPHMDSMMTCRMGTPGCPAHRLAIMSETR
jgi:hypothetical protein